MSLAFVGMSSGPTALPEGQETGRIQHPQRQLQGACFPHVANRCERSVIADRSAQATPRLVVYAVVLRRTSDTFRTPVRIGLANIARFARATVKAHAR